MMPVITLLRLFEDRCAMFFNFKRHEGVSRNGELYVRLDLYKSKGSFSYNVGCDGLVPLFQRIPLLKQTDIFDKYDNYHDEVSVRMKGRDSL